MNHKNMEKLEQAKIFLEHHELFYRELPNGQLQVDGMNYWATKEKWYCPFTDTKGNGINSFVAHVKRRMKK